MLSLGSWPHYQISYQPEILARVKPFTLLWPCRRWKKVLYQWHLVAMLRQQKPGKSSFIFKVYFKVGQLLLYHNGRKRFLWKILLRLPCSNDSYLGVMGNGVLSVRYVWGRVGITILVLLRISRTNLGHGICAVITVLKPVPIIRLFSTSLSSNQDYLSQRSSMRTVKLKEK